MGRSVEGLELQSRIDYSGPFKGGALGPTSGEASHGCEIPKHYGK